MHDPIAIRRPVSLFLDYEENDQKVLLLLLLLPDPTTMPRRPLQQPLGPFLPEYLRQWKTRRKRWCCRCSETERKPLIEKQSLRPSCHIPFTCVFSASRCGFLLLTLVGSSKVIPLKAQRNA